MRLIDALDKSLVQLDIPGDSKKRALENISALFSESFTDIETADVFEALMARERLGSTGIGHGIAIPHCRTEGIERCIAGVFRLTTPINFDAEDNQTVDIVIVLVVPREETQAHLSLLANIAECFQDEAFCTKIRQAKTTDECYQLIANT